MQERRAEAGAAMELRFEEMLERALEEGEITVAQMEEILAKRTEIAQSIDEFSDLPPEERRAANQELRDSAIDWAEENDLDPGVLMGPGQGGPGRSQSRGNGG